LYQESTLQFSKLLKQALDSYSVLKGRYHLTIPIGSFLCWLALSVNVCGYCIYRQALIKGISILPDRLFATNRQFEHCIYFSLANFQNTVQWREAIPELAKIIVLHLK
jgi:DNA-binding transcriptional MocR family regulator